MGSRGQEDRGTGKLAMACDEVEKYPNEDKTLLVRSNGVFFFSFLALASSVMTVGGSCRVVGQGEKQS